MSRERECLIHIGTHKTGTSLFQQILYDDPAMHSGGAVVYPRGIIWPYDRSHNLFGIYFWDGIRPDLKMVSFERMVEQVLTEAADADRVVLSSETLEKCLLRGNGRIRDFVAILKARGYRVTVLYVIRRPDHLADSVFKQWVRDFDTRFRDMPLNMARDEACDMNFAQIADGWRSLPGVDRVRIVLYRDSDPLRATATLLEMCGTPQDVSRWREKIANPSLDGFALRFKHFINAFSFDRDFNERLLDVIDRLIGQGSNGPRLTIFSPENRTAYLASFEDDWTHLERGYGVDLGRWRTPVTSASELFLPLMPSEVVRGFQWLEGADPTVAQTLRTIVRAEQPQVV